MQVGAHALDPRLCSELGQALVNLLSLRLASAPAQQHMNQGMPYSPVRVSGSIEHPPALGHRGSGKEVECCSADRPGLILAKQSSQGAAELGCLAAVQILNGGESDRGVGAVQGSMQGVEDDRIPGGFQRFHGCHRFPCCAGVVDQLHKPFHCSPFWDSAKHPHGGQGRFRPKQGVGDAVDLFAGYGNGTSNGSAHAWYSPVGKWVRNCLAASLWRARMSRSPEAEAHG